MSWDLGIKNFWSKGSARPAETRMDGQVRRLRSDATRHEQPHPPRKKVVANVESVKPNDVYGKGHSTQDERRTESSASLTRAIVTSKEITATEPKRPRAPPKKAFKPVHDEYSAEDIHRLLDSVNDQIRELATDGACGWIHLPKHEKGWELKETWRNKEDQELMNTIGKPCFEILKSIRPDDSDASVLLRIAYQALIVSSLVPALDPFMAAFPKSYYGDEPILDILGEGDRIRNLRDGLDAYSLWRISKHRELRTSLNAEDEADNIRGYSRTACIWCFHCTTLFMGEHLLVWESFQNSVLPQLEDITRDILKLSIMMHEGVITQEYSIYRVTYPEKVDKLRMEIEENDLDSYSAASDRVLCTIRLGLQCLGSPGPSGSHPSLVVKKARVLTENVVRSMYPDLSRFDATVLKAKAASANLVPPASLTMEVHPASAVQPAPRPHGSLPEREHVATERDARTRLNHPNVIPPIGSGAQEVVVREASLHRHPATENASSLSGPNYRASFPSGSHRIIDAVSRPEAEGTDIWLDPNSKLEVAKQGPADVLEQYQKMKTLLESREVGLSGLKASLKLEGDEKSNSNILKLMDSIGDLVEEFANSSPSWSVIKPRDRGTYGRITAGERIELEEQLGKDLVLYLANTRIQDGYGFPAISFVWHGIITRRIRSLLREVPIVSPSLPEEQASSERLSESICEISFRCACLLLQDDRPRITTFKQKFLPRVKEIMEETTTLAKMYRDSASLAAVINRIRHLEISRERISISFDSRLLGYGGFGDVRAAFLDGSKAIAVKALRPHGDEEELERLAKRFFREIDVWARLHHPNIHPFVGFYLAPDRSVAWLISSLCTRGNARIYLKNAELVEVDRVRMILDTVKGLQYLHESDPPIYHGDIKAANVLITDDTSAVLCDFGLAKLLGFKTGLTTSGIGGTARYLSPEVADGQPLTLNSDIWAWGCLVLEVMFGGTPYEKCATEPQVYRQLGIPVAPANVEELQAAEPIARLLHDCWSFVPEQRPSASECMRRVDEYYRQVSQQ